jgi:predicted transcriptional regulator of viral defense system
MKNQTLTQTKLKKAGIGTFFRPRDLKSLEVSFMDLKRLVAAETVEKVSHGLYRLSAAEPDEFETIAMVSSAIPSGIICLLSALRIHNIGTQSPHEVWIAIDRKARKPANIPARLRIVRFSGAMLSYSILTREYQGVQVRVTSPARTIVDCFRYRNKIGLDVALEALRDAIRSKVVTVDQIMRTAEVCHARTVMESYMEAIY